jgi:pyrroline-5-carboxylate reductase
MRETIGFIGGGNMAKSLAGGLIARGLAAHQIIISDPVTAQLETLSAQLGVRTTADNDVVAQNADVVILAVKPQDLRGVAASLSLMLQARRPLVISIAAGIRGSDIERWLGGLPVVRAMPNRPALQNCGVTGLYAAPSVSAPARALATEILGAVGVTVWVDEETQMDAVTAVSGSGPAYFFLLVEMLEAAGISLGLSADVSRRLAIETAYGSGCMARESVDSPADLRKQVTSKGGTTEAALKHLEAHDVRTLFTRAVAAAAHRSAEMAEQLGNQ